MSIDFDSLLYAPLHATFGTSATITPITSASAATVQVIDHTKGIALSLRDGDIETVVPVATIRASVLADAGLTRADLRKAVLSMNGRTYRIESSRPRPTPNGESDGELLMILTEDA